MKGAFYLLQVAAACANGVGSSQIIKMKITKVLKKLKPII